MIASYSIMCIHPISPINSPVHVNVECSDFLSIRNTTAIKIHKQFFSKWMFSFLLGSCRAELLDLMTCEYLIFQTTKQTIFQKLYYFPFPTEMVEVSFSSYFWQCLYYLLNCCYSSRRKTCSMVVFILTFLIGEWCQTSFYIFISHASTNFGTMSTHKFHLLS